MTYTDPDDKRKELVRKVVALFEEAGIEVPAYTEVKEERSNITGATYQKSVRLQVGEWDWSLENAEDEPKFQDFLAHLGALRYLANSRLPYIASRGVWR